MPSINSFLNELAKLSEDNSNSNQEDKNYIRKSSVLVNEALQKGFDVLQMPSGDLLITEVKSVTYKYGWDPITGKFKRTTANI